jgi:hypothetical protein
MDPVYPIPVGVPDVYQGSGNNKLGSEGFTDGLSGFVAYGSGHLEIKFLVYVREVTPVCHFYAGVDQSAGEFFHNIVGKIIVFRFKSHDCPAASRQGLSYLLCGLFYSFLEAISSSGSGIGAAYKQAYKRPRKTDAYSTIIKYLSGGL